MILTLAEVSALCIRVYYTYFVVAPYPWTAELYADVRHTGNGASYKNGVGSFILPSKAPLK